jgi:hypothetical protein
VLFVGIKPDSLHGEKMCDKGNEGNEIGIIWHEEGLDIHCT